MTALPINIVGSMFMAMKKRKSYLPVAIIAGVLIAALVAGVFLFQTRRTKPTLQFASTSKPGAQPPHVRGEPNAPVTLEQFGDFECMPCFILWPALKNVEKDYGDRLSVTFREHPLPQHHNSRDAARAAEAAGLQGRFWEMHDSLYQNRSVWVRALNPRPYFTTYATYLGLDVKRFEKDMTSDEVAKRIADDEARGETLKIDRTPVIYINGELMPFSDSPEDDMRQTIEKALGRHPK
jgi:protein-disulfide isomerase